MSILDRLPGRQRIASLQEELSSVRAAAESQSKTIGLLKSKLEEGLPLDQQRGLSGPFVGGKWDDISGAGGVRAQQIEVARQGYNGTWQDNAGRTRPFGTSRRIVEMHGEYCFGGGVEAPTLAPREDDADAQRLEQALRDWWLYPPNQETAFDMDSQQRLSAKLLVDGEVDFACFAPTAGRPMLLRLMDPLQMGTPVTAPDDASKILYHTRRWSSSRWNVKSGAYDSLGEKRLLYYEDIDLDSSEDIENPYAEDEAFAKQVARDKHGNAIRLLRVGDGYSRMLAMMTWEKQFLALADDQVVISAATAALMTVLQVEGGAAEVAAAQAHFGQSGSDPTTAPRNAGDINVMNQAANLKLNRASVGAGEANTTRRLVQMPQVAVGGVSLHYIGDPENANLATASAMEGPQLKHFEAYQGLWTYIYTRLAKEALREYVDDPRNLKIHVPMPQLIVPDLMDRVDAIKVAQEQGWASKAQATREYWKAMGAADVSAEVETALEGEGEEEEEEAPEVGQPPVPTAPEVPGANPLAAG